MPDKFEKLTNILKKLGSVIISFSGGVDSSFLAAVAKKKSNIKVIAITVASEFQSKRDIDNAVYMAKFLDIEHIIIKINLIKEEKICNNKKDRCYFCKKSIFSVLKKKAVNIGINSIVHGVNIDDLNDFRPGLKASNEMKILAPLVEAGLTKKEIRFYSKKMGLKTWNMPSQSCLATRVAKDQKINRKILSIVEKGEDYLYKLGFRGFRVRCHKNNFARIEFDEKFFKRIKEKDLRTGIIREFKKIGFLYVTVDLEGYSSGSQEV